MYVHSCKTVSTTFTLMSFKIRTNYRGVLQNSLRASERICLSWVTLIKRYTPGAARRLITCLRLMKRIRTPRPSCLNTTIVRQKLLLKQRMQSLKKIEIEKKSAPSRRMSMVTRYNSLLPTLRITKRCGLHEKHEKELSVVSRQKRLRYCSALTFNHVPLKKRSSKQGCRTSYLAPASTTAKR